MQSSSFYRIDNLPHHFFEKCRSLHQANVLKCTFSRERNNTCNARKRLEIQFGRIWWMIDNKAKIVKIVNEKKILHEWRGRPVQMGPTSGDCSLRFVRGKKFIHETFCDFVKKLLRRTEIWCESENRKEERKKYTIKEKRKNLHKWSKKDW